MATTTTAKILLLVLNAPTILLGTALTITASGLKASIVATSPAASAGIDTSNKPADLTV
ncbi:MAG: hypothetical protein ACK5LL_14260 [Suipraeoptans sp.]